jgi:hypothetical protein
MSDGLANGTHDLAPLHDPRHVFLNARDVMRRYRWGKTKGYQNLKDRKLVPPPVMTHHDRWRLDQLMASEDQRIAAAGPDRQLDPRCDGLRDLLPPPKRARRKSA